MPIYEYKCKKCASRFELKKGFNEPSDATCPHCQSEADRVFLPAPIIFKGSGFYVTDHKTTNSTLEDNGKSKAPEATKTTPAPAKAETKSTTEAATTAKKSDKS
jgi:putative FmdB family regulatory protein